MRWRVGVLVCAAGVASCDVTPSVPEDHGVVILSSSESRAIVGRNVIVRVTAATRPGACLARCRDKPYDGHIRFLDASCADGACELVAATNEPADALYVVVAPMRAGHLEIVVHVANDKGAAWMGVGGMEAADPPSIGFDRGFALGKDVAALPGVAFPFAVVARLGEGIEPALELPGLAVDVTGDAVAVDHESSNALGGFLLRTVRPGVATLTARAGNATFSRRVEVADPSDVAAIEFRDYGPHATADDVAFDDAPLPRVTVEIANERAVVPVAILRDGRIAHMAGKGMVTPDAVASFGRTWFEFESVIAGRALGQGVLRLAAGNVSAGLPFEVVPAAGH